MPTELRRLTDADAASVSSLWQAGTAARRRAIGLPALSETESVLDQPGVFGIGLFEPHLVSAAVAVPARGDDGRSEHNIPGLAHISSVVTDPSRWGEGLGGIVTRAIQLQAIRRGYARAQLFTHDTNPGAQRLYEREGFVRSGRQRQSDDGEQMVHYVRDLPLLRTRSRPAARVICLDAEERVLLLNFRDPADGSRLWEPPGGGIEPGESPREALLREWAEETGSPSPELSEGSTIVARDLVWRGDRWVTDEWFFLGRVRGLGVPIPAEAADQAMDAYLGSKWVPWRELDSLQDPVIPDLRPVLQRLDPRGTEANR